MAKLIYPYDANHRFIIETEKRGKFFEAEIQRITKDSTARTDWEVILKLRDPDEIQLVFKIFEELPKRIPRWNRYYGN